MKPSRAKAPTEQAEHVHAYRMTMHLNGCHFYASTYACSCGAQVETYSERDVKRDSYSYVWMVREEGEEACARCEELIAGAKPVHRKTGNKKAGLAS